MGVFLWTEIDTFANSHEISVNTFGARFNAIMVTIVQTQIPKTGNHIFHSVPLQHHGYKWVRVGTSEYEWVRVGMSGYELARVFKSHPKSTVPGQEINLPL